MNLESYIFSTDDIEYIEKEDGTTGISISTHNFQMFLECSRDDAERLANDLLETINNSKNKQE